MCMKKIEIKSIGIDELGRLFVEPENSKFKMIYRTAMEVHWDSRKNVLYSPKPREWSYGRWFIQICDAVKDEYASKLKITLNTKWINISPCLKEEIKKST